MKNLAVITARMSSNRLPGKAMKKIQKVPSIKILYDRLNKSKLIDKIVVATTTCLSDDVLVNFLKKNKISYYRGPKDDVTHRVIKTANFFNTKNIILITGDCPLIDFNLVDQCIRVFESNNVDFVTNANIRSFPDGMDAQIFKKSTLIECYKKTIIPKEFEHVTLNMRRNVKKNKIINIIAPPNEYFPKIGLTLDDRRDLILIDKIVKYFWKKKNKDFTCKQILSFLFKNKSLLKINKNVRRKGDK